MKTKETINILRKARKKIENGWCKDTYAKTKSGRSVDFETKEATNFCSLGAIYAVTSKLAHRGAAINALETTIAIKRTGSINLALFNDDQKSKYPVLALFDETIKRLKEHKND
jgi:hypothetical protein